MIVVFINLKFISFSLKRLKWLFFSVFYMVVEVKLDVELIVRLFEEEKNNKRKVDIYFVLYVIMKKLCCFFDYLYDLFMLGLGYFGYVLLVIFIFSDVIICFGFESEDVFFNWSIL